MSDERIEGYDLARALAVLGMVVVNFTVSMQVEGGPRWLELAGGALEGRAAATFVVLAGVGLSLQARRPLASGDATALRSVRARILRRALFLFAVGLLYTPLWPADILHFYGAYLAVGALLLSAPARVVAGAALAAALGFVVLLLTLDYEAGWDWTALEYEGFWQPAGFARSLFFNGFHPVLPWVAFLLAGLLLGRIDLSVPAMRRRVVWVSASIAAAAELLSFALTRLADSAFGAAEAEELGYLVGTQPMPPVPLYLLAGGGVACAVIALCVDVGMRARGRAWLRPLVATGQLALTLYVAHVVVGLGLVEELGGLEGRSRIFAVCAALAFFAGSVAVSHVWRKRYARGPLEALMRHLCG